MVDCLLSNPGSGCRSSAAVNESRQSVPFPIPYQGSKRRLAPAILTWFPSDVRTLYEPFCGSAAVTLAALASKKVTFAYLNDSNDSLMRLWDEIIAHPSALADKYRALWVEQLGDERSYYDRIRDNFNRTHEPDHFLYLLARCVKAAIRYNANGEFNQSPDNRRKGAHPDRMEDHIKRASHVLRGKVVLSSVDYREAIASATPEDLVYMDPPYQGVGMRRDRRYQDVLRFESFVATLEQLNRRSISYIVSYDGRMGDKTYGQRLPASLELEHLEIDAGRSTQATLLGRTDKTTESLYLSPALCERLYLKAGCSFIRRGP
jgi:DNA adenine methylase